ncbi:MAG: hypothetical protein JKY61_02090 [Planctomycetes bacterium]|nr:hypothetical protein [Planctomycetota bacterium]
MDPFSVVLFPSLVAATAIAAFYGCEKELQTVCGSLEKLNPIELKP